MAWSPRFVGGQADFALPDVASYLALPRGITRLGVVLCIALVLAYGLVYFAKAIDRLGDDARAHAALNYDDREFAGGNALVSNAPLYEARALIPENERYRYVVGAGLEGEAATRAIQVGDYVRYFLMPRRPAPAARWVFCYACRTHRARRGLPDPLPGRGAHPSRQVGAVSIGSLAGLLALNLVAFAVGAGLLWGLRGWTTWVELVHLAGFAYLLGIAGLGIALTLELVAGVPFSLATILATGAVLAAAGVVVGMRLGRPRPVFGTPRLRSFGPAGAVLAALVVVYLKALFRAARLSGLQCRGVAWHRPASHQGWADVRRFSPVLIVVAATLAYPVAVLAFAGAPEFPSRDDCVVSVTGEGEYEVVFGYRDSRREALELQAQVEAVGLTETDIEADGCGRLRVSVDDVPSREVGEEVIRQAGTVGLEPTLEQEG